MSFKSNVVSLSSTDTTIVQMPVGVEGSVHGLVVCNNNADTREFTLKLLDASDGVTYVIGTFAVGGSSQFTWPKPINLEAGDAVIASGIDLTVLHSTIESTAAASPSSFQGRGEWSSAATYTVNNVVSYEGNSYVANAENINSAPPSVNWTLLSAKGQDSDLLDLIRKPTPVVPLTGGLSVSPNVALTATPYASIYSADVRDVRVFEVTTPADTGFATPVATMSVNNDSASVVPFLPVESSFIWRCKDVSTEGRESQWSDVQSFTTNAVSVGTPVVIVSDAPSSVTQAPTIYTNTFTTVPYQDGTHVATNWWIRDSVTKEVVWSSLNDTENLTSVSVMSGFLAPNKSYDFEAQHISDMYGQSVVGTTTANTRFAFTDILYPMYDAMDTFQPVNYNSSLDYKYLNEEYGVYLRTEVSSVSSNNHSGFIGLAKLVDGVYTPIKNSELFISDYVYLNSGHQNIDFDFLTENLIVVGYTYYESSENKSVRSFSLQVNLVDEVLTANPESIVQLSTDVGEHIDALALVGVNATQAVIAYYRGTSTATAYARVCTYIGTGVVVGSERSGASLGGSSTTVSSDARSVRQFTLKRVNNDTVANLRAASSSTNYGVHGGVFRIVGSGVNASLSGIRGNLYVATSSSVARDLKLYTNILVFNENKLGFLTPNSRTDNTLRFHVFTRESSASNFDTSPNRTYQGVEESSFHSHSAFVINENTIAFRLNSNEYQVYSFNEAQSTTALTPVGVPQTTTYGLRVSVIHKNINNLLDGTRQYLGVYNPSKNVLGLNRVSVSETNIINFNPKFDMLGSAIRSTSQSFHYNNANTLESMSSSRAVSSYVTRGLNSSSTSDNELNIHLLDISKEVPEVIQKYAVELENVGSSNTYSICALTDTKFLMVLPNEIRLYSIANDSVTLLSTVESGYSGGARTDICRVDSSRAVVVYDGFCKSRVIHVGADNTLSLSTPVDLSTYSSIGYASISVIDDSKGIIAFRASSNIYYSRFTIEAGEVVLKQVDLAGGPCPNSVRILLKPLDVDSFIVYHPNTSGSNWVLRSLRIDEVNGLVQNPSTTVATDSTSVTRPNDLSVVDNAGGLIFNLVDSKYEIVPFTIASKNAAPSIGTTPIFNYESTISYTPNIRAIRPVNDPLVRSDYTLVTYLNNLSGDDLRYKMFKLLRGTN